MGPTNDGLYRFANGVARPFRIPRDGLSDDKVSELFEDGEGNVGLLLPRHRSLSSCQRGFVFEQTRAWWNRWLGRSCLTRRSHDMDDWTTGPYSHKGRRDSGDHVEGRLPGQQVTALLEDHQGVLWIGVDQDLFSYSHGRFSKKVRRDGKSTGMVVRVARIRTSRYGSSPPARIGFCD